MNSLKPNLVQPGDIFVVDGQGWLWGTCAETRAWDETTGSEPIRLFKYCFVFVLFSFSVSDKESTIFEKKPFDFTSCFFSLTSSLLKEG